MKWRNALGGQFHRQWLIADIAAKPSLSMVEDLPELDLGHAELISPKYYLAATSFLPESRCLLFINALSPVIKPRRLL